MISAQNSRIDYYGRLQETIQFVRRFNIQLTFLLIKNESGLEDLKNHLSMRDFFENVDSTLPAVVRTTAQ